MSALKQRIHQWSWVLLLMFGLFGLIFPIVGVIALLCMLAPVITAFFHGRRWCGVYCPRGSFNDAILAKYSKKRKIPAVFQAVWFKLIFLAILMGLFTVQLVLVWGNMAAVGTVFVRMVIITTIAAVFLGHNYQHRTWCSICPMGTLAEYIAKMSMVMKKIKHVTFENDKCSSCKLCSKSCPLQIEVHRYHEKGKVLDASCLKCAVCVEKCPKKVLKIA